MLTAKIETWLWLKSTPYAVRLCDWLAKIAFANRQYDTAEAFCDLADDFERMLQEWRWVANRLGMH